MAEYPIPPWLRPPPDPGEEYVQAFHAGASIAGEQARLNAQAIQAQQEQEMQKQRLEISKQQFQLEHGLRQQQLQQQQQLVQARTQQAARQFQIQQTFQQKQQQYRAAGLDEQEATRRALMEVGPGIGTGAAQFYRDISPPTPPQVQYTPKGEEYLYNPRTGQFGFPRAGLPSEGKMTQQANAQIRSLEAQIRRIDKEEIPMAVVKKAMQPGEDMETTTARLKQEKIDRLQDRIDALEGGGEVPTESPQTTDAPAPAGATTKSGHRVISIVPAGQAADTGEPWQQTVRDFAETGLNAMVPGAQLGSTLQELRRRRLGQP